MYKMMLFLHILGAMFMFAAVGLTLAGMFGMLFAKENKFIQIWSSFTVKADEFLPFSVILVILPGLYLVITAWGWKISWLNVSLIALGIMTILGPLINLPRFKSIQKTVNEESENLPSPTLLKKIRNRTLWNSVSVMTMELLGLIYLMTVKPSIFASLFTLALGIVLGLIFSAICLNLAAKKEAATKKTEA